jgi:hypothetical protein
MGTGGRRRNAGRPGWRGSVISYAPLDIRRVIAKGALRPGARAYYRWESGDWLDLEALLLTPNTLRVPAGMRPWPEGMADLVRLTGSINGWTVKHSIGLERTRQHFGSWRLWWTCPRCSARRAILYGVARDGRFGCRGCMNLAYPVESADVVTRAWRKIEKLEAQVEQTGTRYIRPKGMHWRTFHALCDRIDAAYKELDWHASGHLRGLKRPPSLGSAHKLSRVFPRPRGAHL